MAEEHGTEGLQEVEDEYVELRMQSPEAERRSKMSVTHFALDEGEWMEVQVVK